MPILTTIDPRSASEAFTRLVPVEFARDRLVISQGRSAAAPEADSDSIPELLAVSGRPDDAIIAHNIAARLARPVVTAPAAAEQIAQALDTLAERAVAATSSPRRGTPGSATRTSESGDEEQSGVSESDVQAILDADERDLLQTEGRAPVVRLVNGLLFEALHRRASDVHIQALHEGTSVRYRVDGLLVEGPAGGLPRKLLEPIVSRVKVMAQMDIAERRIPQDGRAAVRIGDKEIDLRISSLPTALGERLVIRLLDKRDVEMFTLTRLGMPAEVRGRFEAVCDRPHGMVLVTGPTGSGKTTTLYAALKRMDSVELNIMTLEDPVEYELPGVSQSQVNSKKGVTFATGLRHILRQDPDVIMVGEVRDAETARVAVQASLTGHLVFSTLHTNDAASAVTRLLDLGVEPYLLNASLSAVLAQRLVRLMCQACLSTGRAGASSERCPACLGAGYRGRAGLFELLVVDDTIRRLVHMGGGATSGGSGGSATAGEIRAAARRANPPMRTLREAGLEAVAAGLTTIEEVDRVILLEDEEPSVSSAK